MAGLPSSEVAADPSYADVFGLPSITFHSCLSTLPMYVTSIAAVVTGAPGFSLRVEWEPLPLESVRKLSWILTGSFCLCLFHICTACVTERDENWALYCCYAMEEGAASTCETALTSERLTQSLAPALVSECHGKAASSSLQGSLADFAVCSPVCGKWGCEWVSRSRRELGLLFYIHLFTLISFL